MGIRFRCHHCEHDLNLKNFQAGRRARCPSCAGRFRVPTSSADFSLPLDDNETELDNSGAANPVSSRGPNFVLEQPSGEIDALALAEAKRQATTIRTNLASHSQNAISGKENNASGAVVNSGHEMHVAASGRPAGAAGPVMPPAIAEAPQSVWYVRPPSGGQYGPADGSLFYQWMLDNRVAREALVWRDGWPQWRIAGEAFEEYFGSSWRLANAEEEQVEEPTPLSLSSGSREERGSVDNDAAVASTPLEASSARPASQSGPVQLAAQAQLEAETSGALVCAPDGSLATSNTLPPSRARTGAAAPRRKKKQANYTVLIVVLALLALTLVSVLAVVVLQQQSGSAPAKGDGSSSAALLRPLTHA